jgi:hypothetical protein
VRPDKGNQMQTCSPRKSDAMGAGWNPPGGIWGLCMVVAFRALSDRACSIKCQELHRELVRAELAGEISEFWALNLQAILAISERSRFARDYLDMAEAVASSSRELAIIAEARRAYDWLQANPLAANSYLEEALHRDDRAMDLWHRLMIELSRLGEMESPMRPSRRRGDRCR